jgi:hypothetical protein
MPTKGDSESGSNNPIDGQGEFSSAWKRFVQALRRLLSGVPAERSLDPFLPLRDTALDASERPDVIAELEQAWAALHAPNASPDVAHLFLMELNAFPSSVEIAESEVKENKPFPKKRLLSAGKTLLDSGRDIFETLPWKVKGVLKVLTEVIDLLRGE